MAKSARASRTKANNAALKKKVFGPVESARNERLNAKLLELAQQPKEKMEIEQEAAPEEAPALKETEETEETEETADVDMDAASSKPRRSKREIKRIQDERRTQRIEKNPRKKARNQVSFPARKKKGGKR